MIIWIRRKSLKFKPFLKINLKILNIYFYKIELVKNSDN